jgi:hypothetical protein
MKKIKSLNKIFFYQIKRYFNKLNAYNLVLLYKNNKIVSSFK